MLSNKTAIVTGAARGIGRQTATLLASLGAQVVMADVDESIADAARETQGDTIGVQADLMLDGAAERIVATAVSQTGRIDIVVNNAGYTADGALHTMTDEQFGDMLTIHTVAPFRILRAAAPHMREPAKVERKQGSLTHRKVVNVTSVSGTMGNAMQANYAAGKAGIVGLTKSLAKEWGPLGINVNAVAFGFIDTRLTAARSEMDETVMIGSREAHLGVPEQTRSMVEMFTPLGKLGSVDDAAGPIAFLCSPWSDYVTGQVLTVSGGLPFGMSS